MFDKLTGLGIGIMVFAIVIGVTTITLTNFSGAVATCASGFTWNNSVGNCQNTTGSTSTPTNSAYTNVAYMNTQTGTTGLAGWTPAIVAFSVGMLFIGGILTLRGGDKGRY